jgi:hypothetical protein
MAAVGQAEGRPAERTLFGPRSVWPTFSESNCENDSRFKAAAAQDAWMHSIHENCLVSVPLVMPAIAT